MIRSALHIGRWRKHDICKFFSLHDVKQSISKVGETYCQRSYHKRNCASSDHAPFPLQRGVCNQPSILNTHYLSHYPSYSAHLLNCYCTPSTQHLNQYFLYNTQHLNRSSTYNTQHLNQYITHSTQRLNYYSTHNTQNINQYFTKIRKTHNHHSTYNTKNSNHNSARNTQLLVLNHRPLHNTQHKQYCTSADQELCLANPKVSAYLARLRERYESSVGGGGEDAKMAAVDLRPVMLNLDQADKIQRDLDDLTQMAEDPDTDAVMRDLARTDLLDLQDKLQEVQDEILWQLLPADNMDDTDVMLEVSAGVGGQEAMLFCQEVMAMYLGYAAYRGWTMDVQDNEATDIGGTRHASAIVRGEGAYGALKYEGGTHRVQRVPRTEKAGRIHTSTVSVAVMPMPTEIDVQISDKDLRVETKRASGAGGQHVNTTDSAVRIVHLPTGLAVESQKERSQHRNKEECMRKLRTYLYQTQLEQNMSKFEAQRKLQVGSKARSEKIRTYNFPQDRVTDHRIGCSVHNIPGVLAGAGDLHDLVTRVGQAAWEEQVWEVIHAGLGD